MKVKIAVVQFEIEQYRPEENLKKAESFIQKASEQGAGVIIFPEDFITGPLIKRTEFADNNGKYAKYFQSLAAKYKIDIIPGTFIENINNTFFNTSYYIDSKGKIKGIYKKTNLWLSERRNITAGNYISVFNTNFGKAGLIICWDLMFPEIFRRLVRQGVKIIYCPSYWCYQDAGRGIKFDKNAEIKSVNSLCTARAFENGVIIVYANAAGKLTVGKIKDTLIGQSQIAIPFKGVIKRLDNNKEAMFIQEINTDILNIAEKSYKIREDLRYRII